MIRGEAIRFEEMDKYKSPMRRSGIQQVYVFRTEGKNLVEVAQFSDEGEAEIAGAVLAERFGQCIIVKGEKRAVRFNGTEE